MAIYSEFFMTSREIPNQPAIQGVSMEKPTGTALAYRQEITNAMGSEACELRLPVNGSRRCFWHVHFCIFDA